MIPRRDPIPVLEPAVDELIPLIESLTEAHYKLAGNPDRRTQYMELIRSAAQKIVHQTTRPEDALKQFLFQPHQNATVRLAISMGIFHAIPPTEPISLTQLARDMVAESEFVQRITRVLVAMGILLEPQPSTYAHTGLSLLWRNDSIQAYTIHQWDDLNASMAHFPTYFGQSGFRSPEDPNNAPFTFAMGAQDASFFDIIAQDPDRQSNFSQAMAFIPAGVTDLFPFQDIRYRSDRVAVVDVGGGKGDAILEIQTALPSLKGRCVLQDQPAVLELGSVVPEEDVELQAYDFFSEIQPVKGAAVYLYKWIFHDWPDSKCRDILRNLAPAMTPGYSRLLISDLVISDEKPELAKVLFDVNMINIAGKERSRREWEALLGSAGFRIVNVYSRGTDGNSIIEGVLKAKATDLPRCRL